MPPLNFLGALSGALGDAFVGYGKDVAHRDELGLQNRKLAADEARTRTLDAENKRMHNAQLENYASEIETRKARLEQERTMRTPEFEAMYKRAKEGNPDAQAGITRIVAGHPNAAALLAPFDKRDVIRDHMTMRNYDIQHPLKPTGVPRAPTEAQEKALNYFRMMTDAEPEMERLMKGGRIRKDFLSAALMAPEWSQPIANRVLNSDEQQYLRAARDFATGVKRPESGAALKDSEIWDILQRYVDLGGDAPELGQAKAVARREKRNTLHDLSLPAQMYLDAVKAGGVQMVDPAAEAADPGGGGVGFGGNAAVAPAPIPSARGSTLSRTTMRTRSMGGSAGVPSLTPLSSLDKTRAKSDAGFQTFLTQKGYLKGRDY